MTKSSSLPLIIHKDFSENIILAVSDLSKVPELFKIGYVVAGTARLLQRQFQDRGSMYQYNLAGGLQIPVEPVRYAGKAGIEDLYLITCSWRNKDKRIEKNYARAINPKDGPLVFEKGKFRMIEADDEPIMVNKILGGLPYGIHVYKKVQQIGTLTTTRNLDGDSKIYWLEDFAFNAMVEQKKRLSYIDFDPDDGAALG
jgi:hypothetical protein